MSSVFFVSYVILLQDHKVLKSYYRNMGSPTNKTKLGKVLFVTMLWWLLWKYKFFIKYGTFWIQWSGFKSTLMLSHSKRYIQSGTLPKGEFPLVCILFEGEAGTCSWQVPALTSRADRCGDIYEYVQSSPVFVAVDSYIFWGGEIGAPL